NSNGNYVHFTGITAPGFLLTATPSVTSNNNPRAPVNAIQIIPTSQPVAPTITSANSAAFSMGTAGSFTVTATGFPTPTLSETGTLPAGVTFNVATGVL